MCTDLREREPVALHPGERRPPEQVLMLDETLHPLVDPACKPPGVHAPREFLDLASRGGEAVEKERTHPLFIPGEFPEHLPALGHGPFRRCRRRRRPEVRGEVAEGGVHLVADGADHRRPACGDGPHDVGVIEGEEVLEASASAPDDDHVHEPVDSPDRLRDLGVGPIALDGRRGEDHLDRIPPVDDREDVLHCRTGRGGDHADPVREERDGPFPLRGEEPLGVEFLFPALDHEVALAETRREHLPDDQLVSPVRFVDFYGPPGEDVHAVFRRKAERGCGGAPHHAVDQRGIPSVSLRKREIAVAGGMVLIVGHLSTDPDLVQASVVEEVADESRDL